MKQLPFGMNLPPCPRCGRPLTNGTTTCSLCQDGFRPVFRKLSFPFLYQGLVKDTLIRFKSPDYRHYGTTLALHMEMALRSTFSQFPWDLVIPVPSGRQKKKPVSYNQAATLAKALSKRLCLPCLPYALRQKEARKKQSTLSARDRVENVAGNFLVVNPSQIVGKQILLVDDISTTGATLNECAKILYQAGATLVDCSVAALTWEDDFSKKS